MAFQLNNTTGDLELVNGNLKLATGTQAIDQHLRAKLRTFLGEWFLDTRIGIPYFQQILGRKNPPVNLISAILRKAILQTSGVVSVSNLQLALDSKTRELVVAFEAKTTLENIIFSETLGG